MIESRVLGATVRVLTALLIVFVSTFGVLPQAGAAVCTAEATAPGCGCASTAEGCGGCCAPDDTATGPLVPEPTPTVCACGVAPDAPATATAAEVPVRSGVQERAGTATVAELEGTASRPSERSVRGRSAIADPPGTDTAHDPARLSVWRL